MNGGVDRSSFSFTSSGHDQALVKKMLRELINDAEVISMELDREIFDTNSLMGISKTLVSNVETLIVKFRRSEKSPKFNAKEVNKDRRAIGKVLKKK